MRLETFLDKSIIMYCDNKGAIEYMKNAKSSNKTRHINLKFHFVRDEIEKGEIDVRYIETKLMVADFLTKDMTYEKLIWTLREIKG